MNSHRSDIINSKGAKPTATTCTPQSRVIPPPAYLIGEALQRLVTWALDLLVPCRERAVAVHLLVLCREYPEESSCSLGWGCRPRWQREVGRREQARCECWVVMRVVNAAKELWSLCVWTAQAGMLFGDCWVLVCGARCDAAEQMRLWCVCAYF